ncbi:MAG: DUF5979 domain-containing protein [Lachnospiraceae bacterium]|nr:DUF5979 domain-containing protein [Lachnospiraceae bacterium]
MALILTISMVLNMPLSWSRQLGISNVYASASNAKKEDAVWATASNAKYKQGDGSDVDIYVVADDNEIVPGNVSSMTLYLRNNTGEEITDGVLTFAGKKIKGEDGWFTGITEVGSEETGVITGKAAANRSEPSGEGLLDLDPEMEAAETEVQPAAALEGQADRPQEAEASIQESGQIQDVKVSIMEPDDREAAESAEAAEREAEFGGEEDEEEENESSRLTDIDLLPGQLYEVSFEFYTEDDLKSQSAYVKFRFAGEGSRGVVKGETKFYYSIGLPVVNLELEGGSAVETGIENEMNIWMSEPDWVDDHLEEILKEQESKKTEKEEEANSKTASSSDAGKATASNAKKASSSNASGSTSSYKDLPSVMDAAKIEKYTDEAMEIKESKVSYTVELWGTRYKRFSPKKAEEVEDIGWISCIYELAGDQEPGIYYGKVTAKGKWNRKSFTSEQGFLFEVTGEHVSPAYHAEAKLDNVTIHVSADEGVLPEGTRLFVKELKEDDAETADKFLEAKEALDAEGTEYSGMMALDMAFFDEDGNKIEPDSDAGNVRVSMEMNSSLLPKDADLGSVAVQHLAEREAGIEVQTVADVTDAVNGTVEVREAEEVVAVDFEVESFSVFAVTWNDGYELRKVPEGTIEAKVYLRYSNEIPTTINGSDTAAGYGPSGNNTPYITVTVDLDQVNQKSACYQRYDYYTGYSTWYYYSIESDGQYQNGSKEEAARYWNTVIYPAIEENDRNELDRIFGGEGKYIGYVLKRENDGWHIDGVLADNPPNYVVELYDYSASGTPCLFAISDNDRTLPGVSYGAFKEQLETTLGGTNYRYVTEQTDQIVVEYQKDGHTCRTTITPRNKASHIYPSTRFGYEMITNNIYYLCQLKMETKVISGDLSISKEVAGSAKNVNEHFKFTLRGRGLDGEYEAVYTGTDPSCNVQHTSSVKFTAGSAEISLKHGEMVFIKNLPLDQQITITEQPGSYTTAVEVTVDGERVSAEKVVVTIDGKDREVHFKNIQTISAPTGLFQNQIPYCLMLVLSALGILGFTYFDCTKKKRRTRR